MKRPPSLRVGLESCLLFGLLALFVAAQPLQVPVKPRINPNPFDRNPHSESCRIQDIRAVSNRPDSMSFEVQYSIPANSVGACFMSARVPDIHNASPAFTDVPAGAVPFGVPKGDIRFNDHVMFSLNYLGEQALTTPTIEVFISDENGSVICSQKVQWRKTWSPPGGENAGVAGQGSAISPAGSVQNRAEVRGLKAVSETPGRVRFQVRYWLDPTYPRACFISAAVPDFSAPLATITATPAGIAPDGVPKGHQTYEDNVAFELASAGSSPLSTSTVEVRIIDQDGRVLASSVRPWSHDWAVR